MFGASSGIKSLGLQFADGVLIWPTLARILPRRLGPRVPRATPARRHLQVESPRFRYAESRSSGTSGVELLALAAPLYLIHFACALSRSQANKTEPFRRSRD